MIRHFDPIDIIFIVFILSYFIVLFLIIFFTKKNKIKLLEFEPKTPQNKKVKKKKNTKNLFQKMTEVLKQKSITITTEKKAIENIEQAILKEKQNEEKSLKSNTPKKRSTKTKKSSNKKKNTKNKNSKKKSSNKNSKRKK